MTEPVKQVNSQILNLQFYNVLYFELKASQLVRF